MARETIEKFNGLYTAADKFSTPGSPQMNDWDINLNSNLEKTEGYTRVEGAASTTASAYLNVTGFTAEASAQAYIASANWFFSASSPVTLYGFGDTTFSNVAANNVWNIVSASATAIELEGCDTTGLTPIEGTFKTNILFNDKIDSTTNDGVVYDEAETFNSRSFNMGNFEPKILANLSFDASAITVDKMCFSFLLKGNLDVTLNILESRDGSKVFYVEADSAGQFVFALDDGAGSTIFDGTAGYAADTLYHVVIMIDNTAGLAGAKSVNMYVGGVSIYSTNTAWTAFSMDDGTYFGAGTPGAGTAEQYMYDLTILDSSAIIAAGVTEASIVSELYNNTFDGAYKFVNEYVGNTAKADPSMQLLHGFVDGGAGGIDLDDVSCQGAYFDSTDDIIYSFLANGSETKSYLVQTDKDTAAWRFTEGSSTASATAFGTTHKAWFDHYGSHIIFTKNETQGNNAISLVTSGGLFRLNASGQLALYGAFNNPTGKYLETHKDRIWVGNITALSGQAQDGESWVQVSKFLPEAADTRASLVNSGIVFGEGTAQIIVPGHSFKVGDEIYLSGVTLSGVQDDMNQRLHTVIGLNGSGVIIEYNNVNDLGWDTTVGTSGGDALLRGPTWGTPLLIYDDLLEGAGIFRCDDNTDDAVMQLQSSFGALAILREQNPYMFTGAIESGNQTLARPLNVPYSTVSPFVYLTAGGVWFVSQYGVSKIEGTTIKTNQNQLDNIVDLTVIESIKPTFDAITTKSGLIVYGIDRRVLIHDPSTNITLVFDTLKAVWYRWYDRLADRFVDVGEDVYSVYKHLVFKWEDGNKAFSLPSYSATNLNSSYFTKVYDQGSMINTKIYNALYSLLQGAATSATANNITINVYFNGEASPKLSFAWDVKTSTLQTWNDITTDGTVTWNAVTTTGTVTWASLLGDLISMLQQRKYRLGSAQQIQFEIAHSDDSAPKVSRLFLDYDVLDIDTIQ